MQRAVRGVLGLTSIFLGYFWVLTQAPQHSHAFMLYIPADRPLQGRSSKTKQPPPRGLSPAGGGLAPPPFGVLPAGSGYRAAGGSGCEGSGSRQSHDR